ncbi:MAG: polysaccharide biosynthesis C-terminal domain-containing protein [Flavobacteriaceae bacterium]|nr:polysaccharide biosynthesis C-terminal domain-containing protein [Flavobacteriaceae bacterium]
MSQFKLDSPSRRKTVKILIVGNYSVMVIDIIQGLAFVPLYLNYLGERLYGLWLGTGGIIAVLAFLDMGIATLVIQRISREYGKKNFDGISTYFFSGLLINAFFMSILFIAGYVLSINLESFFKQMSPEETEVLAEAFQVALVALILGLMNNLIEGTLNALQKPLFGKIIQIIAATLGLITTYIMLVKRETVMAIPAGMMVRTVVSILPNIVYLFLLFSKNHIKMFTIRWVTMKDYLLLTPNLLLSKVGSSLVGNIEPTLINMFLTPEIAVYFSVTKKAGGLIKTILDRVGGVLYPSMAHLFADSMLEKFRGFCIKLINLLLPISLLGFSAFVILNKAFVGLWVGTENYLGDLMTVLIALSLILSYYSNTLSYLLSTTGDIKFPNNAVFFESMIKLVLLYLLLKFFGVYGLPIAIAATSGVFVALYIWRWNGHLKLDSQQKKILFKTTSKILLALIVATTVLYYIVSAITLHGFLEFFLVGVLVFVTLVITTVLFNAQIKSFFTQRIQLIKTYAKSKRY